MLGQSVFQILWLPSHDFIYFNHCKKTLGRPQLDEFDTKSRYN